MKQFHFKDLLEEGKAYRSWAGKGQSNTNKQIWKEWLNISLNITLEKPREMEVKTGNAGTKAHKVQ